MSLRHASAGRRAVLESSVPITGHRFYIDFRQNHYPPILDTGTYTKIGNDEPGDFNLTGGFASFLLGLSDEATLAVRVKPGFSYTGSDEPICSWYLSATQYLTLMYDGTANRYQLKWRDAGTERILESDVYAADLALQVWTDIAVVWDMSAGTGAMYVDGVLADAAWSDAPDAMAANFHTFELRAENGVAGDYEVSYARLFQGYEATAQEVEDYFADVKVEELWWALEGVALCVSRVNVTRFVARHDFTAEAEKQEDASIAANKIDLTLWSKDGKFADDQYGAWDPANAVYNGTSAQRYMQSRVGVYAEHWYTDLPELFFVGRVSERGFQRNTPINGVSAVKISCEDFARELAVTDIKDAVAWADKDLSSATEADSLVHLIMRERSQKKILNLAANSSFENATIGNSWTVFGAAATFSRVAGGLFGSYAGELVYGSAACGIGQIVTFLGKARLNKGETYAFIIALQSASACGDLILLEERDAVGVNDYSSAAWALSGGEGWTLFEVSHTITDSDSDRLRIVVELDDNVSLSVDAAVFVRGSRAPNWFVLNVTDGVAGVVSADDAVSDAYDQIGFDVDVVAITHPWAILEAGDSPWSQAQEIADATCAFYVGIGKTGAFRFRSPFKTGFTDPTTLLTITDPVDMEARPHEAAANSITVRGRTVQKDDTAREIWNAITAGGFIGGDNWLFEPVVDGAYWPHTDRSEYWAQYASIGWKQVEEDATKWWQLRKRTRTRNVRTVTTQEGEKIIGATDLSVVHNAFTTPTPGLWYGDPCQFDVTVFDVTTKADAARIELQNNEGVDGVISAIAIRGKLVKRFSDRVHDSFVNEESVFLNGEIGFEVENDFIITETQTRRIAEFWAKYFQPPQKHEFTWTFRGERLHYEPGEWYALDAGGTGEKENVDAVARCLSVRVSGGPGGAETSVLFQEVLQNWTFNSNAISRKQASGRSIDIEGGVASIVVASSSYVGKADSYCDGTDDDVQIQAAINALAGQGGGELLLTKGTFAVMASLLLQSGCEFVGSGPKTIVEKNLSGPAIEITGADDSDRVSGVKVGAMTITQAAADTDTSPLVNVEHAEGITIEQVTVRDGLGDGVRLFNANVSRVSGLDVSDNRGDGINVLDKTRFGAGSDVRVSATFVVTNRASATMLTDAVAIYASPYLTDDIYPGVVVGAVDGRDITSWGSFQEAEAAVGTLYQVARLSDTTFILVWRRNSDGYIRGCVGTVSGSTVAWGAVKEIYGADSSQPKIALLSATSFVVAVSTASGLQAIACTISGTTITAGSVTAIDTSTTVYAGPEAVALSASAFATIHARPASGGTYVTVSTVSGTTITAGSPTAVSASTSAQNDVTALSSGLLMCVYTVDASGAPSVKFGTVSGTTVTLGAEKLLPTTGTTTFVSCTRGSATNGLIAWSDGNAARRLVLTWAEADGAEVLNIGGLAVVDEEFSERMELSDDGAGGVFLTSVMGRATLRARVGDYTDVESDGLSIVDNKVTGNFGAGILVAGHHNQVLGNFVKESRGVAIINGGDYNTIDQNRMENNGNLLFGGACEYSEAAGVYIKSDARKLTNVTLVAEASIVYAGVQSFKVAVTSGGSVGEYFFSSSEVTTAMHTLIAELSYELSGRIYVPSTGGPQASEVSLLFSYYDSGAWVDFEVSPASQDEWLLLTTGSVPIPSTATGTRAKLVIAAAASSGEFVYMDDMRLKPVGVHNEHQTNFLDYGEGTVL